MNYRNALIIPFLLLLLAPWGMQAQGQGMQGTLAPNLVCTVTLDADSLFYIANDYSPNRVNVTVEVTNIGDEPVGGIGANLVKNPRFVIGGDGQNPKPLTPDTLGPNESASATFELIVAFAPQKNVLDTVLVTVTSNRGYTVCSDVVWVEREVRANIDCTNIFKTFTDGIKFIDSLNTYDPDTAYVELTYTNIGQDVLYDGVISRILPPGLSSDDTDPIRNVGDIIAAQSGTRSFGIVPKNRDNDTTTTLCFGIQGRTGYKDYQTGEIPLWQDTCCVDIFIPRSRQPKYEVECMVEDSVLYVDHEYQPPVVQFSVRVRNVGTAEGNAPVGTLNLPPGMAPFTDPDGQPKLMTTKLGIGETTDWVTWTLEPQRRTSMDSLCVVAIVKDVYGYTGSTVCCVVVDSIRQAQFQVDCASTVDSVVVDTVIGAYINGTFDVVFNVCNTGSDYADSVVATLSIQSPDIQIVEPVDNIKPLWQEIGHTLATGLAPGEREDTLSQQSCWTFVWPVAALPRGVSGDVCMTFTIDAPNAKEQTCEVCVYVPRLDPPDIVQECYTNPGYDPSDTLHISAETGGYEPERITFCTVVKNDGGGTARNVVAYFSPPENMLLAPIPGNTSAKPVIPGGSGPNDVGPNDEVTVCWEVIPLPRYESGRWIEFRADLTSDSQEGISPTVCGVFVPRRPVTTALSISRDNLTYFGADEVAVPVYVDQSDDKDIRSVDLHFKYNVDQDGNPLKIPGTTDDLLLLEFLGAIRGPIFPERDWSFEGKIDPLPGFDPQHYGRVRYAGTSELEGFGLLFYLVFKPIFGAEPYHLDYQVSELAWPSANMVDSLVKINDGLIQPILQPGEVVVSGDCLRPITASDNYIITQNRPNPFNPTTTIDYQVPSATHIRIEVLDVLGRTVEVLVDGLVSEGQHSVMFNAEGLTSGMYFYRMSAPGYSKIMKMMVSK